MLSIDQHVGERLQGMGIFKSAGLQAGQRLRVQVSADELAAHEARLVALRKKAGGQCLWDA